MSLTFDEVCWACQMVTRFYPEPVPMSVLAEVAGKDIASHLIGATPADVEIERQSNA